jgi:hypothetical protein
MLYSIIIGFLIGAVWGFWLLYEKKYILAGLLPAWYSAAATGIRLIIIGLFVRYLLRLSTLSPILVVISLVISMWVVIFGMKEPI